MFFPVESDSIYLAVGPMKCKGGQVAEKRGMWHSTSPTSFVFPFAL